MNVYIYICGIHFAARSMIITSPLSYQTNYFALSLSPSEVFCFSFSFVKAPHIVPSCTHMDSVLKKTAPLKTYTLNHTHFIRYHPPSFGISFSLVKTSTGRGTKKSGVTIAYIFCCGLLNCL